MNNNCFICKKIVKYETAYKLKCFYFTENIKTVLFYSLQFTSVYHHLCVEYINKCICKLYFVIYIVPFGSTRS